MWTPRSSGFDKELAAPTWKRTYGFHPLACFLDRPEVSSGEALAAMLRPSNAGSNTAADHKTVLRRALDSLPCHARPRPGDKSSPSYVVRSDSAGATHEFAKACREMGVAFSFGLRVTPRCARPSPRSTPRAGERRSRRTARGVRAPWSPR